VTWQDELKIHRLKEFKEDSKKRRVQKKKTLTSTQLPELD
jgi:hypothetical protein